LPGQRRYIGKVILATAQYRPVGPSPLSMIERLRTLSPLPRYSMYVAGVLLMLCIAVGVGATTAVVFSWQSGRAATGASGTGATVAGPAETSVREGSTSETTGIARAPEDTEVEPPGDSSAFRDATIKASFVHRADRANSRGDYTYISDPSINGRPNAKIFASLTSGRGDTGSYKHNIGVWYESAARRWAIFNQDRAPVPAGSTFEVVVPQKSEKFLHEADLLNTAGNYTYLDDPLTNGEPDAVVSVTQNWNPGGGRGVYNDHPVDTMYDSTLEQWAVYNRDGASMPEGAAFNIAVSTGVDEP
jgi:hypothetical protein